MLFEDTQTWSRSKVKKSFFVSYISLDLCKGFTKKGGWFIGFLILYLFLRLLLFVLVTLGGRLVYSFISSSSFSSARDTAEKDISILWILSEISSI